MPEVGEVGAERPVALGGELEVVRLGHGQQGHVQEPSGGLRAAEAAAAGGLALGGSLGIGRLAAAFG